MRLLDSASGCHGASGRRRRPQQSTHGAWPRRTHRQYACPGRAGQTWKMPVRSELLKASEIVLSCAPHAARDVPVEVVQLGFSGCMRSVTRFSRSDPCIQRIVEGGGAALRDGGIIGGPAWTREAKTHLICGTAGQGSGGLLCGNPLQSSVISDRIGQHRP